MMVSGFSFIRNGNALGYPFVQAIQSVLPLCDEFVLNVPHSTDGTLDTVRAIGDPRLRIIESKWDESLRTSGLALSHHTNLALEQCRGDWCVYVQGDEVLHERSIPELRAAMEGNLNRAEVQGLLVHYTHFYGSYWTCACSFGWYRREVRVVRRDPRIRSRGDAQGFRTVAGEKLRVKDSGAEYFHYGHALHPEMARRKFDNLNRLWHSDEKAAQMARRNSEFYDTDQKVEPFRGAHPQVMRKIVAAADWTYQSRNPVVRFRKKLFWNDLAYLIWRWTGIAIGVHKNYREI